MDRSLFLAMSGAKQNMNAMQLRANNLANVSTTGFKADLAQARSMQAYGDGLASRVFAMTERAGNNFSQGSIITTGRNLDVAIEGRGWMAVLDGNGKEGLTRDGNLFIDQNGLLTNSKGYPVLDANDTPITLPIPVAKVEIGIDGTISVLPQGAPAEELAAIGQIKLVNPPEQELFKGLSGLFYNKDTNADYDVDNTIKLQSGLLEGSNVNPITEMTALIDLQRQFEMQVKMMSNAEDMSKSSDTLLRSS